MDADGIQDPSETPIAGVTVELLDAGGTVIATAVTDASGNYIFTYHDYDHPGTWMSLDADPDTADHEGIVPGGLAPNTDYTIRIDNTQAAVSDYSPTADSAGTNDNHDSDGLVNGTFFEIPVTTGTAGENNHTLDFGYVEGIDLALDKTTLQTDPVNLGDDVTFTITVTNQGGVLAQNVQVTDYIPAGFTLNDPNWTAAGTGVGPDTATYTFPDAFPSSGDASGDDIQTVDIILSVNDPYDGPAELINEAEISYMENSDGEQETEDLDSIPDNDSTNDAGGNVDSPNDDFIDGDGTGTPDDEVDTTDEDDHDPENVFLVADLALIKQITPEDAAVTPGQDVTFDLTITNQGAVDAHNVLVTDYIPSGFTLNDTAWTAAGTDATIVIPGPIAGSGGTHSLTITLTVDDPYTGPQSMENQAEITEFQDVDGSILSDIDSTPDNDKANDYADGQGMDDSDQDDVIDDDAINQVDNDGDGVVDEDDSDGENVFLEADLALAKTLAAGETELVQQGQDVSFDITVTNQGDVDAYDVVVTDYIPAGFTLSTNDTNGWTGGPGPGSVTSPAIAGPIAAGSGVEVLTIILTVDDPYTQTDNQLVNYAEISAGNDSNGDPLNDVDSTPDADDTNDTGGTVNDPTQDDNIDDDGTVDEDDHDPEDVLVALPDVALIKNVTGSDGTTITEDPVVAAGEDITFLIYVENQGNIDISNIDVIDYIPDCMTLNDLNWVDNGNGTASYTETTILAAASAPGAADGGNIVIPITLTLDDPYTCTGLFVENKAEVAEIDSSDGTITGLTDIDSTLDIDVSNDYAGGEGMDDSTQDDVIVDQVKQGLDNDGDGVIDEDDADGENIKVMVDIALKKTGDKDQALLGEDITHTIEVVNQGSLDLANITVVDYIPLGQTFIDTSGTWFSDSALTTPATNPTAGPLTVYAGIAGPLTSQGGSDTLTIVTEITDPWPAGADVYTVNFAEVFYMESLDGEDLSLEDIDSTPDDDNTNDNGGLYDTPPNHPSDNDDYIDGDGKAPGGAPLDGEADTDEDDHDPHDVLALLDDLALSKTITSVNGVPVNDTVPATDPMVIPTVIPGDEIEYTVCVYNQGYRDAFDVVITDYIPAGLVYSVNDTNGWLGGVGGVTTDAAITEEFSFIPTLFPESDPTTATEADFPRVCEDLVLTVEDPYTGSSTIVNRAEIYSANDSDGSEIVDVDSEQEINENNGQDADDGGTPGDPDEDNYIMDRVELGIDTNDDGVIDEDDEDPAMVQVPFDLALTKTLSSTGPFAPGDPVVFEVCVTNQGHIEALQIELIDYFPTGLRLDPADPNWTWGTPHPNSAVTTLAGPIAAQGGVECIDIMAIINDDLPASVTELVNYTEISSAQDKDGNNPLDIDSTPDQDNSNDPGGTPNTPEDDHIDDDGTDSDGDGITDEDDHDPAVVVLGDPVLPAPGISIIKTAGDAADGDTYTINAAGDVVFTYLVTNTGNTYLSDITITDDAGTANDTSDDVTLTSTECSDLAGPLEPTGTVTCTLELPVADSPYENNASTTGNPTDKDGNDITGVDDPTDEDPAKVAIPLGPALELKKYVIDPSDGTTEVDAQDQAAAVLHDEGETANYVIYVANTGNTHLNITDNDYTVSDDNCDAGSLVFNSGDDAPADSLLSIGETWRFTCTISNVTGDFENIASVLGQPVDENGDPLTDPATGQPLADLSDEDPANVKVNTPDPQPGVELKKYVYNALADTWHDAQGSDTAVLHDQGETALYQISVDNTGDTILDIKDAVTDDTCDAAPAYKEGDTNTNGLLDVDEIWFYQCTVANVASAFENIASVEATPVDENGDPLTDPSTGQPFTPLTDDDPANIQVKKTVTPPVKKPAEKPTLVPTGSGTNTLLALGTLITFIAMGTALKRRIIKL